ncbi:MAG: hypothetical protein QF675_02365 [SAR324 cluster bacterium]|nr:hypothetical protein [SAR324 cluster bacterium]
MGTDGPRDPKAADVASSILRELGVDGSEKDGVEKSDLELAKSTEADPSTGKDPSTNKAQEDLEPGKQDSLQGFRRVSLQLGYAALAGITGFIILLIAGGYLNLIDRSLFKQLLENRFHQIEFDENLRSRLVKNHLNREPLVVLEGGLRNLFNTEDTVSHVRLKALAFDDQNNLLESRTGFAGILLNDEELKRLSRSEIVRLFGLKQGREIPNENLLWKQELPFQAVFFTTGKKINRTSVQIVSYHRNGEMVYVRTPDSES